MKKLLVTSAFMMGLAAPSFANSDYTVEITANGKNYLCKAEVIELESGQKGRSCIEKRDRGTAKLASGLGGTGAGIAIVSLVLVGAALSGGSDNTNGTN